MKGRTALDGLCVTIDGCKTVVVFMHRTGVLDTPEIAENGAPKCCPASRPRGSSMAQDPADITPFPKVL